MSDEKKCPKCRERENTTRTYQRHGLAPKGGPTPTIVCFYCGTDEDKGRIAQSMRCLRNQLAHALEELASEKAENKRLRKEVSEANTEWENICCSLPPMEGGDVATKVQKLADDNKQLREIVRKVSLCFPDKIPEGQVGVSFNIPAYIIEELREAAEAAKDKG